MMDKTKMYEAAVPM